MKNSSSAAVDFQQSFPGFCPVEDAVATLSSAGVEERGAIFTRREVVDFILDLVGYQPDRKLHELRLLEPSFGGGDFLVPAIERLLEAAKRDQAPAESVRRAIRGVELHAATFESTKRQVRSLLAEAGYPSAIADAWLVSGDFLLADLEPGFDFVVGNPPYVRQELLPDALIQEYRRRYTTVYDRADIYVPFIERSLRLLSDKGTLGFICADRWMENRYDGPLRRFVAEGFHLRTYVDMYDVPAFHSDVIAYPAVFVIGREEGRTTRIARRPEVDREHLTELARELSAKRLTSGSVTEVGVVTAGDGRRA